MVGELSGHGSRRDPAKAVIPAAAVIPRSSRHPRKSVIPAKAGIHLLPRCRRLSSQL